MARTAAIGDCARVLLLTRALLLAGAIVAVTGCSSGGSIFGGTSRANLPLAADEGQNSDASEPGGAATGTLSVYFDLMLRLTNDDPLTQAEAFNAARDAWDYAPITTNKLRYALALSLPGHPGSDPAAAANLLRQVVATGDILREERMLAQIQLRQAERLEVLEANVAELRSLAASNEAARSAASAATIRRLEAEIANLRTELEGATDMLDAITSIEESISEREDP
jgi:hypothetical protein